MTKIIFALYNPETDCRIFANFSAEKPQNKKKNKAELQKLMGLPQRDDVPVISMVTRLVSHKGLDLCKEVGLNCIVFDLRIHDLSARMISSSCSTTMTVLPRSRS